MAASRKNSDWWETFLYVGLFILIALFLYQLLKLWQAGIAKIDNAASTLSQAAANTISAVENGLSNLLINPAAVIASMFDAVPDLLSLAVSFIGSILGFGFLATLSAWLGFLVSSVFGSAAPITTGLGSSASGSGYANLTNPPTGGTTVPITNGFSDQVTP